MCSLDELLDTVDDAEIAESTSNSHSAAALTVAEYMDLLDPTDRDDVLLYLRDDELGLAERDVPAHNLPQQDMRASRCAAFTSKKPCGRDGCEFQRVPAPKSTRSSGEST